jgi:putative ABC transport system permease protein
VELAQDIDRSMLIGRDFAIAALEVDEAPGTVYLRSDPDAVDDVRAVVAATVNPGDPDQVTVSRPSDAIAAKAAASSAFTSLFLALGAVALLVGGVGIANVMVISVLERRSEIGLRRALGATRRHVSIQFLAEALLLSAIGGLAGAVLGSAVTAVYDVIRGWGVLVPYTGIASGIAAAIVIGAIAGLYPAVRASRLSPTEALRTV